MSRLFARTDDIVLALDHLRVHPNGFDVVIVLMTNPRLPLELQMGGFHTISLIAGRAAAKVGGNARPPCPIPGPPMNRRRFMDGPRMGVQFANGQRAGARPESYFDVQKDEAGIPIEPVMMGGGRGGGGGVYRSERWVFPLPSPGPLTVFAEWSEAGIAETSVVLDGDEIRDAAQRGLVIWS